MTLKEVRPRIRFIIAILTHFAEIAAQIATLLVLAVLVERIQFWSTVTLGLLWAFDVFLHAADFRFAEQDRPDPSFRRFVRTLSFGIARWSQVQRILEVYRKSSEQQQHRQHRPVTTASPHGAEGQDEVRLPTIARGDANGSREMPLLDANQEQVGQRYLHGKTSHSVVAAFPFALMSLYGFCVMDISTEMDCSWHIYVDRDLFWLRWLLLFTGVVSINSIAACAMDVDYSVSGWVCKQVDASIIYSTLHVGRRWFEVAYRIALLVLLAVVMRTMQWLDRPVLGPMSLCLPAMLFWVINTAILRYTRPAGAPRDAFLVDAGVGFVALVIVPSTFVDVPGYRAAANNVTWGLWMVQSLAIVTLFAITYVLMSFDMTVAEACGWSKIKQLNVLTYLTTEHPYLLLSSAASLFMYILLTVVSLARYGTPARHYDGAMVRVVASRSRVVAAQGLQVVGPRGLSSFLSQVAAGVSGNIVDGEAEDFVIERQLGAGVYGKVLQLRRDIHNQPGTQRYALKLHSGLAAEAELLANIDHPFCVWLLCHFTVPEDHTFLSEDGSDVGRFSMAIMMELCPVGTLEALLARHWCVHDCAPNRAELHQEPLKRACLIHLRLCQRLGAELTEVMACLHDQDPPIVYRDLKPDNVLLREGRDHQLHVCLTDFGFAKQPSFGQELTSVAGNFLTAAPEVPRPWDTTREPYTQYVDNWSLGQTLLCMLWCTYREANNQHFPTLPERTDWEDEDDPRVPPLAAKLIKTLTELEPLNRGTMRGACLAPFFTVPFTHMDEQFQPVQIQVLLEAARR